MCAGGVCGVCMYVCVLEVLQVCECMYVCMGCACLCIVACKLVISSGNNGGGHLLKSNSFQWWCIALII